MDHGYVWRVYVRWIYVILFLAMFIFSGDYAKNKNHCRIMTIEKDRLKVTPRLIRIAI
jgi:hypothetical protein